MARRFWHYEHEKAISVSPQTICQLVANADFHSVVSKIDLQLAGSSGATAPLKFDICEQDDAGASSDDSASVLLNPGSLGGALKTTARKDFTTEPTNSDVIETVRVHQQGYREWKPNNPYGESPVEKATRFGIRVHGAAGLTIGVSVQGEE